MIKSAAQSTIASTQKYRNMNGSYVASSDYKLDEVVLTSTVSSVTFDISTYAAQGYKNLQIRMVTASTSPGGAVDARFNGDSSGSYSGHGIYPTGGGASGYSYTNYSSAPDVGSCVNSSSYPNEFYASIVDIVDFSSSVKNKTIKIFYGLAASQNYVQINSASWRSTSPITSITLFGRNVSLTAGSRFSLYGSL